MENQKAYKKAKERVEAKIGFYYHLGTYIIVNGFFIIINLTTAHWDYWFKWPLIGWGIGLLFHAISVFVFTKESSIKERMIQKEMQKDSPIEQ